MPTGPGVWLADTLAGLTESVHGAAVLRATVEGRAAYLSRGELRGPPSSGRTTPIVIAFITWGGMYWV